MREPEYVGGLKVGRGRASRESKSPGVSDKMSLSRADWESLSVWLGVDGSSGLAGARAK